MMSDEKKTREQLSAYLDGELTPAERQAVQRAVEGDEQLAAELAQLEAARQLVRGLARQKAGDDFATRVLERAERQNLLGPTAEAPVPNRLGWVRWLASAAVILIAVGIGVVIMQFLKSPTFDPQAGSELAHKDQVAGQPQPAAELTTIAAGRAYKSEPAAEGERIEVVLVPPGDAVAGLAAAPEAGGESRLGTELKPLQVQTLPGTRSQGGADLALGSGGLQPAPSADGKLFGIVMTEPIIAPLTLAPATQPAAPQAKVTIAMAEDADRSEVLADIAAAQQEELYTDDLVGAQQQVEAALARNAVETFELADAAGQGRRLDLQQAANVASYLQLAQARPDQVQYVAYVTPTQMAAVTAELASIRGRQKVAQAALPEAGSYVAIERGPEGELRLKQPGAPPAAEQPKRRGTYRTQMRSLALARAPSPKPSAATDSAEPKAGAMPAGPGAPAGPGGPGLGVASPAGGPEPAAAAEADAASAEDAPAQPVQALVITLNYRPPSPSTTSAPARD